MSRDPRVDEYIHAAQPFSREILDYLRGVVHEAVPQAAEAIKWGFPHFTHHGVLCSMAAFKRHCTFGLWKGALLLGETDEKAKSAMGQFGRITAIDDLPPKPELIALLREGARLNEQGVKAPRRKHAPKAELPMPDDFAAALNRNAKASATYDGFPPGQRREYLAWIVGAKADATRARRIATAVEWLADGKRRHWKYEAC